MVRLPEGYCIDSTEVTQGQYEAWLATSPALPDANDVNCGWKASYAQSSVCKGASRCQEPDCNEHPAICIDWCNAFAYCHAVGKRLCGRIGGGANDVGAYTDFTRSQWHNACTSHGVNKYPYGKTYDSQACNGNEYAGTDMMTLAVGTLPTCQSATHGYQGVYDLSGNVSEWEDSCDGVGRSANCKLRGGSYISAFDTVLACDAYGTESRDGCSSNGAVPDVGIRCCSP
jgi:formylglycine-generating enzyme required for sulfatase activity